jgi:histidinol phosphatase-like enzyme
MKRAVFLDRDGVLNIEVGYIHKVEDLHLIPGIAQAVRRLNDQQIFCCLVSNQSGPARGYNPVSHVEALLLSLFKRSRRRNKPRIYAVFNLAKTKYGDVGSRGLGIRFGFAEEFYGRGQSD